MQARVSLILEIRVSKQFRVIRYNSSDEGEVVEQDGAAEARGFVNPVMSVLAG
jgi:hypothetical protein